MTRRAMLRGPAGANPQPCALPEDQAARLRSRGVRLEAYLGESAEEHLDRLDTELMALFRDTADPGDFDALYRHARARLFSWMRWLVRQYRASIDPLDLLQDTFVNVYRYAASFRTGGPVSFRCWVRTIAANVVRRELADRPRRALKNLPLPADELVDPGRGPPLRLVAGEETVLLCKAWLLFLQHYSLAFESLSARDRLALDLVEVQGLSYLETGALLGVGPSNMKMIMLRSRRRLQERMRKSMSLEREVAAKRPPRSAASRRAAPPDSRALRSAPSLRSAPTLRSA